MLSSLSSFLSIGPSEEDIAQVTAALATPIAAALQEDQESFIAAMESLINRENHPKPTRHQLALIFKAVQENKEIKAFMQKDKAFQAWHPDAKLAFKLSITLLTIYSLPPWLLSIPCNKLFIMPLVSFISKKLNLGFYADNFIQFFNFAASLVYRTPSALITEFIKEMINEHGTAGYLLFPAAQLAYAKGPALSRTLTSPLLTWGWKQAKKAHDNVLSPLSDALRNEGPSLRLRHRPY